MPEIIKCYQEKVPAMRFIGKQYADYSHWGEWFANEWFDAVEAAMGGVEAIRACWPDGGGYIGLECRGEGKPFVYWIGMFTPANTPVPDGFDFIDFPAASLGICWIYGEESATHQLTGQCAGKLTEAGISIVPDKNGVVWSFENCTCPRYTTPDEKGNVILDYCYYIL